MTIAPSAPRLAVEHVERGLRLTVLIGQTAGCGIAIVKLSGGGRGSGYPAWFMWTVIVLLLATTVSTYVMPPPKRQTALQLYVLICAAAMVSQIWLWDPAATTYTLPPLDNVLGIGMGLAALAFRWQVATAIVGVFAGSYLVILPRTSSLLDTIGLVSVTCLAGAACVAARGAIDHAIEDFASVEEALQATTDLRESLHRRSMSLVKWRDVLHGKVIGSLLAARRAPSTGEGEMAAALARDALAALAGIAPPASGFGDSLSRLADSTHLRVTATIDGDWSADGPIDAFHSAVAEALANVARHSGQREAIVTARFTPERWQVSISDSGVGFDQSKTDATRGLHISLINPIVSVGGTYEIHSRLGMGTTVTIGWERLSRLAAATSPAGTRWLVVIAFASLIVHFLVGWQVRELTEDSAVLLAGAAAIMILLGLAVAGRKLGVLGFAMLAVQVILAANVNLPVRELWVFWFAGAMSGFSGVLAYRGRIARSAAVVVLSWLAAAITIAASSSQPLGTLGFELAGFYAGPLAATVFGVIGWIITLSHRALMLQATEREAALSEADRVNRSTRQWLDEHGILIARVSPLLEQLAQVTEVSSQLCEDCRVMEAECRDHLEVPTLITPAIAVALERARRRGVSIRFGAEPQAEPTEDSLQLQRALLLQTLDVPSLHSVVLTPALAGISLVIRADPEDIPLDRFGNMAELADVVPLEGGLLARFQIPAAAEKLG